MAGKQETAILEAASRAIQNLRNPIYGSKWANRTTFTVEEAGVEILGLSICSAYAAAARGEIPTVRVGRRLIVPRRALEEMLQG